ncbi:MAG: crossover junction endodeoxyribonuclease RuvC [Deltaproteobacteria bacterium]|nr:crossover junction endodeoxyribonuclease RuvC [Deltaproteobacteria bacterium]
MIVLGIDPGSLFTGYGIVERKKGGTLARLGSGTISPAPALPLHERLLEISNGLSGVIEDFRPHCVAVESLFFSKNVRSAIALSHARGAALVVAAASRLDVFEYSPSSVKQSVTGCGNASKDQVQKMVKTLLKHPQELKADAADALAVAICHLHHCNLSGMVLRTAAQTS